jgi:hypothetical protein
MSFDHKDKDQKFLVAYMNDATFIAFQGMKTLEDVINTFQIDHYSKGHFHKIFKAFGRLQCWYGTLPTLT